MRTVTFKSVFESVLRMHGMDPRGDAVSSDTGLAISDNLNARMQTAWFLWEWPEWTITEERAFRQIWNNSRQFYQAGADGTPDEVFYIPNVATHSLVGAAYYRVKTDASGNPPLGTPPTNTTYWETMDTVDTYVAFDQICRRRIGEVLEVFADNPAICKPPRCLGHRPTENGIQIYEAGGLSTVFVRYLTPAEQFTTFPYIPSRTYLRGDTVYLAEQGECYQAIQVTVGNDPTTATSYWRRVLFPAVLAQYAQLGTYADCLRESDNSDERDPVMLQIRGQRASQAASDAEDEITRQMQRLQAQGQHYSYLPFGVVVPRCGTGGAAGYTIPGYVLQGGGAYNYGPIAPTSNGATTISDFCETEWGYIPPPPVDGGGGGGGTAATGESGSIPLVSGQNYVDVVFATAQIGASWDFIELRVVNTLDPSALNIWPGIVTSKTTTGFRLQLSGAPDSGNYVLQWSIKDATSAGPPPAITYSLSGPTSGAVGVASTNFTVALPTGQSVPAPVTVTPSATGGGTFTPASVTLTTASPSAMFTYTPASAGVKTISTTNDGALSDPASISFTAAAASYSLTGPSSGRISVASTNFTVTLSGTVAGTLTVTPSDGGGGGTFAPTSVGLTTGAPTATFTYTPASYGAKTISVTNSGGLTNPANLTYTSVAAAYTFTGPSGGTVSVASTNFTVQLPAGGVVIGTVTVTPSDGGGGGTFTPTSVPLTTAAPSATFTYTPASTGAKTLSVTNSGTLTNPANLTYTAAAAGGTSHLLTNLISYWKLDETSGTRNDSKGTNHLADSGATNGNTPAIIGNSVDFGGAAHLFIADNASLRVTGDFTFSLWARTYQPSVYGMVLSKWAAAPSTDYLIYNMGGGDGWTFQAGTAAGISAKVGTLPAASTWYHLVCWYDSSDGKLRMRVNDATTYVSTGAATIIQSATPFQLGDWSDPGGGFPLGGRVDEVGFWKRKLNAAEITQLYNGGAGWPFSSFTT